MDLKRRRNDAIRGILIITLGNTILAHESFMVFLT